MGTFDTRGIDDVMLGLSYQNLSYRSNIMFAYAFGRLRVKFD